MSVATAVIGCCLFSSTSQRFGIYECPGDKVYSVLSAGVLFLTGSVVSRGRGVAAVGRFFSLVGIFAGRGRKHRSDNKSIISQFDRNKRDVFLRVFFLGKRHTTGYTLLILLHNRVLISATQESRKKRLQTTTTFQFVQRPYNKQRCCVHFAGFVLLNRPAADTDKTTLSHAVVLHYY